MTSVAAPATKQSASPSSKKRRPAVVAAVALAAVALVAAGGYAVVHAIDAAALAQARVFLDDRSLRCSDLSDITTVTRGDTGGSSDETYAVPAVRGVTDLDCRLSVVVQNNSDRDLDVDEVTFTLLGPESGVGLHTDHAFTQGLDPASGGDRADVTYDYRNQAPIGVSADSARRFAFHLTSDGCRQAGATTTWPNSPTVTATIGTATADLPLEGAGFGFIGAKTSKQPCH